MLSSLSPFLVNKNFVTVEPDLSQTSAANPDPDPIHMFLGLPDPSIIKQK
jgi:hypothetical protein